MRHLILVPFVCAIAAALAQAQTQAQPQIQVKTSGYFSVDFVKGQRDSLSRHGSIQDVRAGLLFSGEFAGRWDYALESRFRSESEFSLEQAWVRLSSSPSLRIKAGLFLVPFGLYNTSNRAHEQALARAPMIVEEAYPRSWREIGLEAEGRIGIFDYAFYIGNGLAEAERFRDGQQFRDRNSDKGMGGRAGLRIGSFELGYSRYQGRADEENIRRLVLQAGDAAWNTEDFRLLAEYIRAEVSNPAPFGKGTCEGFHVQLFFPFDPISFAVGRQELRYQDPFHGPGFLAPATSGLGIDEDRARWALEAIWAPLPDLVFKVEYDFNREAGAARKDDLLTAQLAFHF